MPSISIQLSSLATKLFFENKDVGLRKKLSEALNVKIHTHGLGPKHFRIDGSDESSVQKADILIRALDQRIDGLAKAERIKQKAAITSLHRGIVDLYAEDFLKRLETMPVDKFVLEYIPVYPNSEEKPGTVTVANDFDAASSKIPATVLPTVKEKVKRAETGTVKRAAIPLVDKVFEPRNKTQAIAYPALMDSEVTIAFLAGFAGGGKTHVALRCAVELYNRGDIDQIMLFRPRTVAGSGDPGAMPGNAAKKMEPYIKALSILEDITGLPRSKLTMVSAETPDFERGATYPRSVIIPDEAQDYNVNIATLLATRFGEGSKIFFNGDISDNQNDLKGQFPGLVHLIATHGAAVNGGDKTLQKGTAFLRFTEDDSKARHPLMPHVLKALNSPPSDYADIMAEIRGAGANSKLAVAIQKATMYAKDELEPAANRTYSRYVKTAEKLFPTLFNLPPQRAIHLVEAPELKRA